MFTYDLSPRPDLALVVMHGYPEQTGQALLESHKKNTIEGWEVEVANQTAFDGLRRYVVRMALEFGTQPPARKTPENYELWRPSEIKTIALGRRNVLYIHNRPDSSGEYLALGRALYQFSINSWRELKNLFQTYSHKPNIQMENDVEEIRVLLDENES